MKSLSDPQRKPGTTPRRAQPIQPDKPGRGTEAGKPDQDERRTEASETARETAEETARRVGATPP